ncbi:MAG: hypothetical protein LBI86_09450 [Treponema sp.]|nr:hypothetical protein [Treponema sp.]
MCLLTIALLGGCKFPWWKDKDDDVVFFYGFGDTGSGGSGGNLPTVDLWDGVSVDAFAGGAGSITDPWRIGTGAQLAYLAQEVNAGNNFMGEHVTLTANIDLDDHEWTAIGTDTDPFEGAFDGAGHVIYRLSINKSADDYQGLFGYIGGAEIQRLGLENVNVTGAGRTGGIAGYVLTGSIENSFSTGNVSGTNGTGGVAGYVNSGSIENSYSTGTVNGTDNTGGVAGQVNSSSIEDCYSTGNVSGTGRVGGVAGYVYNSGRIENSYSTGNVSGTGNRIGGVAGYVSGNGGIENSYSTGNVDGTGNSTGGVAGYVYNSGRIENSYSTGNVGGADYTGGVAGEVYDNSSIENSYSTGNVDGTLYTGGVAGSVYTSGVSGSYNTGNVGGASFVGGIAGYVYDSGISGSYSTGTVGGTGNSTGGIVGEVLNGSSIEHCAALNPWVKAATSGAGRVVGFINGGNSFTDNAAWNGMGTNGGVSFTTAPNNAGTGITTAQVQDGTGLPAALKTSPWSYATGTLPILIGPVGQNNTLPAHLQ